MSPRTSIWGACRALAIRARPVAPRPAPFVSALPRNRWYSNDGNDQPPKAIDNEQRIQDVSIPDEVDVPLPPRAKGDVEVNSEPASSSEEVIDDATLEQLFYGGRPQSSPTEGGLTQAQEDVLYREGTIPPADKAEALVAQAEQAELDSPDSTEMRNPGHKFGLPRRPWPEGFNMKKRYHPVLEQITRLLMKDGKLSVAQRNMAIVMNYLRTAPPPIYSPKYPLLPGTPPAPHLPLNPILYITVAVDSVAPLLKIRNVAGAGGGGRALELPVPLGVRQRRRIAFQWILDVINKKPSKGSGRKQFPYRIAEEIVAVVEGRSGVWEKRKMVHKLGTAARANVGSNKLKVKKKM